MTHEPPAPGRPLTATQTSRLDFARRDLESARAAELTDLDKDGLILVVERLRGRLYDVLNVVDEVTRSEPPHPPHR